MLAEFVALAERRRLNRPGSLQFVEALYRNPGVGIVFVDDFLHDDAMQLLMRRQDKSWSLCDAVSFVLMERRNITDALTTDHHFEQAGFIKLLSA